MLDSSVPFSCTDRNFHPAVPDQKYVHTDRRGAFKRFNNTKNVVMSGKLTRYLVSLTPGVTALQHTAEFNLILEIISCFSFVMTVVELTMFYRLLLLKQQIHVRLQMSGCPSEVPRISFYRSFFPGLLTHIITLDTMTYTYALAQAHGYRTDGGVSTGPRLWRECYVTCDADAGFERAILMRIQAFQCLPLRFLPPPLMIPQHKKTIRKNVVMSGKLTRYLVSLTPGVTALQHTAEVGDDAIS
eukprot:gene7206-5064_t